MLFDLSHVTDGLGILLRAVGWLGRWAWAWAWAWAWDWGCLGGFRLPSMNDGAVGDGFLGWIEVGSRCVCGIC